MYEGRNIISLFLLLSTLVVVGLYVYAWRNEHHILRSAYGLLIIYLGGTSFSVGIIIGREWIPSKYKASIVLLLLITAIVIIIITIDHTKKSIKKATYGLRKEEHSLVLDTTIKLSGFGSLTYLLTRGGVRSDAILIVICTYLLMLLMLGYIIKLFMGHYYLKHIDEYKDNVYRVHKRSPIHRN